MSRFSIQTDPGVQYEENEDTVGYDEGLELWLVADGMGGHAAGEVASQIVRDTVIAKIRGGQSPSAAALSAHEEIAAAAEAQQVQQGMGSTLVAMQIADCHASLVWVGDSRVYLWRDEQLTVATHDHSYVQMLIDQGHLTDETARNHPKRNMVTQVLGLGSPEPQTRSLPLHTGDWLVLCSDGLNDELTDDEIASILAASDGVENVADVLVTRALEAGGRDNVSVIAVEYDGPAAEEPEPDDELSAPGWLPAELASFLRSPLFYGIAAAIAVFIIFFLVTGG